MKPSRPVFLTLAAVYLAMVFSRDALARDIAVPSDFATIGEAVQASSPDDRVVVSTPGPFRESLRISAPLTLVSDPPGALLSDPTSSYGLLITDSAKSVRVEGFRISGYREHGIFLEAEMGAVALALEGTEISDNGACGLRVWGGPRHDLAIRNCAFESNRGCAVLTRAEGPILLENSSFVGNQEGVRIDVPASLGDVSVESLSVKDCEFRDNSFSGLTLRENSRTSATLSNSIFTENKNGVLLLSYGQAPVRMSFVQCQMISNRESGLRVENPAERHDVFSNAPQNVLEGPLDHISLTDCDLSANRLQGLTASLPIEMSLWKCRVAENGREGLLLSATPPFTMPATAEVTIQDTVVTRNAWAGIHISRGLAAEVDLTNVESSENRHGLFLAPIEDFPVHVTMDTCLFENNLHSGVYVETGGVTLTGSGPCRLDGNAKYGFKARQPSAISFFDADFSRNGESGFELGGYGTPPAAEPGGIVASLERCTVSSNSIAGVRLCGEASARIAMTECNLTGNPLGFLADPRNGASDEAQLVSCTFSDASIGAISTASPTDLLVQGCVFGPACKPFRIFQKPGIQNDPTGIAQVQIDSCDIDVPLFPVAHLVGAVSSDLTIRNTHIASSDGLLRVEPAKGYTHVVRVEGTTWPDSAPATLALGLPAALAGTLSEDGREYASFLSPSVHLLVETTADSVETAASESFDRIDSEVLFQNLSSQQIKAIGPSRRAGDGVVLSPEDKTAPPSFEDLEKNPKIAHASAVLFGIGDLFAESRSLKRETCGSEALAYLSLHPDSPVACRLFQNLIGDVLKLDDPEHLSSLALIVRDHPDSPVSDAICLEVAMASVRDNGKIDLARQFLELAAPPDGSLSKTLLNSVVTAGGNDLQKAASLADTFTQTSSDFSAVRQSSLGSLAHVADRRTTEGVHLFIDRCVTLNMLIRQARIWRRLGRNDLAEVFRQAAGRARIAFYPSVPDGLPLPASLQDQYVTLLAESPQAPDLDMASILNSPPAEEDSLVANRLSALQLLVEFCGRMRNLPEVATSDLPTGAEDILLPFWADLKTGIENGLDAGIFNKHGAFLEKALLPGVAPDQRLPTLDELVLETDTITPPQGALAAAYHYLLARLYRNLDRENEELDRLGLTVDSDPQSENAYQALERKTDLYLDRFDLPDKALETQERILSEFASTDKIWGARSRIGRILARMQRYEEARAALTALLAEAPKDYDRYEDRVALGLTCIRLKQFDESRAALRDAIDGHAGPERQRAYLLLAYTYFVEKRYPEAADVYQEMLAQYPTGPQAVKARELLARCL